MVEEQTIILLFQTFKNTMLLAFGGISIITIGLSTFLANLMLTKFNNKWSEQSERELTRFQNEMDTKISLLNSTLNSYSTGQNLLSEKRFHAVETMWENIVDLRKSQPVNSAYFFYTIYSPDEYEVEKEKYVDTHHNYDEEEIARIGEQFTDGVEKQKIYLGGHIWGIFYGYRTFLLRLAFILHAGIIREYGFEKIISWTEDKYIMSILDNLLDEDEMAYAKSDGPMNLKFIMEIIEAYILKGCQSILRGEVAAKESIDSLKQVSDYYNYTVNLNN